MTTGRTLSGKWWASLAVIFAAAATILVSFSPRHSIYDEGYYHGYAADLERKGLGLEYLRQLHAPAGPLYGMIHHALSPISDLQPVAMRILTNGLFFLTGLVLAALLLRIAAANAAACPAMLYAIPFAGVTFGVALTEVPAMLVSSMGMLALAAGLRPFENNADPAELRSAPGFWQVYLPMMLAGVLLAASVWGRQNYLVLLLALPVLFWSPRGFLPVPWLVVSGLLVALSGLLFAIWGGMLPELARYAADAVASQQTVGVFAGLNLVFGIRSLAYAALVFAVLCPKVFTTKKSFVAGSALVAFLAALLFEPLRFLPSEFLLRSLLPDSLLPVAAFVSGATANFLGLWLLSSVALHCLGLVESTPDGSARITRFPGLQLADRFYVFAAIAWMLLLATNMKISHQFSSRYVLVAVPFMVVTAARHFDPTALSALRLAAGFFVSMVLLANYYGWV